jgi:hypothetical protein
MRLAKTGIIAVAALLCSTACVERVGVGSDAPGGNATTSAGGGSSSEVPLCPQQEYGNVQLNGMVSGVPVCTWFAASSSFASGDFGNGWGTYDEAAVHPVQGALLLENTSSPWWTCGKEGASCGVGTPCCNSDCHSGVCGGTMNPANLFQLPTTGEWFCAASAVATAGFTGNTVDLSNLAKLGSCPGAPVAGSVTICLDGNNGCSGMGTAISSTLAGATFAWQGPFLPWDEGDLDFFFNLMGPASPTDDPSTFALIQWDTHLLSDGHTLSAGPVSGGILVLGPGTPDAGAVYCIGGGTGSADAQHFTLTNLSRLGTCADNPISGSIEVQAMF